MLNTTTKKFKSDLLISKLLDLQPDSVVWFCPVFSDDQEKIIDFEVQYCNASAANYLGVGINNVLGARVNNSTLVDEFTGKLIFEQCLKVYTSGEHLEFDYYNPSFDKYYNAQRSKVHNGVLSITRDRTREVKLEFEFQHDENRYKHIINSGDEGIMVLEPVHNNSNAITDFKIKYCNKKGFKIGKLPTDSIGKTLFQVLPKLKKGNQLSIHKKVFETGRNDRFETQFTAPDGKPYGWFIVSVSKMGNEIVSRFTDITERKKYEREIESQRDMLRETIDASLNAIFACEGVRDENNKLIDLRYVQINQMYKQLIGKNEDIVIGKTMAELFPKTKVNGLLNVHMQVIETGISQRFETHYEGDGLHSWYDVSSVKIGDNGVFITFADITEQKTLLSHVEQQKNLLDNILKHSPSGITVSKTIKDNDGNIIDFRSVIANDISEKFSGIPREILLSKTAIEVDPNLKDSPVFEMALNTLKTGEPFNFQYHLESTGRWLELSVSKLDDDHMINVFSDITERKEAEYQLEKSLLNLQRSNTSLEEFAYVASHDLHEPLRKINLFTEQIRAEVEPNLSDKNKIKFDKIQRATFRMQNLIDDLLAYSKVSGANNEMEIVDLNLEVQLILSDLEASIVENYAEIEIDNLCKVKGDAVQLRQLFQNLLGNALKYSKPDTPPQIKVTCQNIQGKDAPLPVSEDDLLKSFYLITITDNGIGFEPEYSERIFKMFQRLHGQSQYSGTGVGLAIVHKVIQNHGGYIMAEGQTDVGATFKLMLPA